MSTISHQPVDEAGSPRNQLATAWQQAEAWRTTSHRPQLAKPRRHADAVAEWLASRLVAGWPSVRRYLRVASSVTQLEPSYAGMTPAALDGRLTELRERYRLGRTRAADRVHALAAVREAGRRELGLFAYREQVAAAAAILDGRMTEMATGEGKTLVAALAATLIAWRGRGCHVVTVNDYLAERDATCAAPLYRACGNRVASITGQTPPHERRDAYAADVTYTTHKETAADYLRDQLAREAGEDRRSMPLLSRLARELTLEGGASAGGLTSGFTSGGGGLPGGVMRGLEAAIVDEADSILLDEAVTPLIISGNDGDEAAWTAAFAAAARAVTDFEEGGDFRLDRRHRDLALTRAGRRRIGALCKSLAAAADPLNGRARPAKLRGREELLHQALVARHLYLHGDQYVIRDGKIVIVDQATGRLMPDRTWQAGLHQAVEAKENLEISPLNQTLASVSYQRFFRLYRHLAGMTGTAWDGRAELWQTYRMHTVRVPTHRPCRRKTLRPRPLPSLDAKWDRVTQTVSQLHAEGRPVLVGTRSVDDSETVSHCLTAAGIPHDVLNARHHEDEAAIVAEAGQRGRVTVATNMAGRGTDIKLPPDVVDLGGLAVIATDRAESPRVDRQLQGRAARQGEPGTATVLTSLDDPLLVKFAPRSRRLLKRLGPAAPTRFIHHAFATAQTRAARLAAHQRRQVLLRDEHLADQLSY